MTGRPDWAEVWWCDLDRAGRRPVLVLTRPEATTVLRRLLVAPATTTIRGLSSEVELDESDGLPRRCVVNLDGAELIARTALTEFIATLSMARMDEVCAAFRHAVNC